MKLLLLIASLSLSGFAQLPPTGSSIGFLTATGIGTCSPPTASWALICATPNGFLESINALPYTTFGSSVSTVAVGTVTSLPAGSTPTVTNSGTPVAAVLNFGIPKGDPGTGGIPNNGDCTAKFNGVNPDGSWKLHITCP